MFKIYRLFAALGLFLLAAGAAPAQAPHAFPFRATNYDVEVMLHPEDQTISAHVKVNFVATQVSRTLLVELHPDLRVNSMKTADGKELSFDRDNNSPLLLSVALPGVATPGKEIDLVFDYAGPISSEDDSPTRGVRFASVDKTSAYLLLPARWFPLTNYPANRYTGTFQHHRARHVRGRRHWARPMRPPPCRVSAMRPASPRTFSIAISPSRSAHSSPEPCSFPQSRRRATSSRFTRRRLRPPQRSPTEILSRRS